MGLKEFLQRAKSRSYASGSKAKTFSDGSKQVRYNEKGFQYIDSWLSSTNGRRFTGNEEVINSKGKGWEMNYQGYFLMDLEVEEVEETTDFIREALKRVPVEIPFRGPVQLIRGSLKYINKVKGDVNKFAGIESIFADGVEIYQLIYSGGFQSK